MEATMKKIICITAMLVVCGLSEGMLESRYTCSGQKIRYGYPEHNLDVLPGYSLWQEQWEIQRKRGMYAEVWQSLDSIKDVITKTSSVSSSSSFDKPNFLLFINPLIKESFENLLNNSLEGSIEDLMYLSNKIEVGYLDGEPIFRESKKLNERKDIIFTLSLKIFQDHASSAKTSLGAISNIYAYCPDKAKAIGIDYKEDEVTRLFRMLQAEDLQ
jgi:hypothetical protein